MRSGWLEEWLDATARTANGLGGSFQFAFPVARSARLVPPPRTAWPPAGSGKLYCKGAQLVPLEVALAGH